MQSEDHLSSEKRVLVLYSEAAGGMAHYAEHLFEGLSAICRASIYCISPDDGLTTNPGRFVRCLEQNKVLFKLRRKYNRFRYFRIARKLIADFQPDHVHLSHFFSGAREIVMMLKRHHVPVSLTIHDPKPHEENRTRWGRVQNVLVRKTKLPQTLSLVDRIHVHSALHRVSLMAQYPHLKNNRIYVVQHGGGASGTIRKGTLVPEELERLNREQDRSVILFFGRIEPYKGLSLLFEAVEEMLHARRDFFVVIAGAGVLPPVPESIRERLILINRFIRDEEIAALFKSALVTVLPYLSGTQTGVIPLASTFNVPSVVSKVGALPELILENETGMLVPPADASALSKALLSYLDNPELAHRHGQAAYRFLQSDYSWERVNDLHLQEFSRINLASGV